MGHGGGGRRRARQAHEVALDSQIADNVSRGSAATRAIHRDVGGCTECRTVHRGPCALD
jgi:hypothetical protein